MMTTNDVEAMATLDRAGWSVGEYATRVAPGRVVHVVTAHNLVDRIKVEAATRHEAWLAAGAEVRRLLGPRNAPRR